MSRFNGAIFLSCKGAIVAYCLLFFGLASPYILFGEVIAPNRQSIEVGAIDSFLKSGHIENRKFGDYTNLYIPEISEHLKGSRSGWLTLWTDKNELGRPTYQISGFSPAYLPSFIIAQFTNSPWWFITVLSLLSCFLAGIFLILFCTEIGFSPFAGLIAGSTLMSSPLFMYWLTFPMFPAVWCWAAGALWAVTCLARKSDLLSWSILAFCAYSSLMTAYPQPVVFQVYILGGYCLYLAYRKYQIEVIEAGRFLMLALTALVIGGFLALPAYIDLAHISAESARVAPDPSFFTEVLPKFDSWMDAVRFFVLGTTPELFGNPVGAKYQFPYDGLSITPVVIFFAVISLCVAVKKTWGWWMAIIILCLFAFVHPLYVLGVKYLGFGLSPSTPLGNILLPLTVITAFGADALVKRSELRDSSKVVGVAVVCVLATITIGLSFGITHAIKVHWAMVLIMLFLASLFTAQYDRTRPVILIIALITVSVFISYPLMLRQDPSQIATMSPLVEKVRANLPVGSRYAVAAPGIAALPPNLNAGLGLASVHSYNSLSSSRYHTLIKALGGVMQTYGRWNSAISPNYSSVKFWMSNISLMLSPEKLNNKNLELLGKESGVYLYKVISRMGFSLQVDSSPAITKANGVFIADPRLLPHGVPFKLLDQGDLLEFEVTSGVPSVLILSQKFHRDWQAQVLVHAGWKPAKTIVVNGVFQGVILPKDAVKVRLQFKPYVRYAWIAHLFWLLLLALLGFRAWREKHDQGTKGVLKSERNAYSI